MTNEELIEKSKEAMILARAKYSNFRVGAALLTDDNKLYLGANIENASYGLTICAERTAAFNAVLNKETKFKTIAISSDADDFIPPCGACRQVLAELCGKDLDVIMTNKKGDSKTVKISELLPLAFDENYL